MCAGKPFNYCLESGDTNQRKKHLLILKQWKPCPEKGGMRYCWWTGGIIIPIAVQLQLSNNHFRSVCVCVFVTVCQVVPQLKTLEVILPNLCV
jgi:hypothetical protein